jgi:hypothetical protein
VIPRDAGHISFENGCPSDNWEVEFLPLEGNWGKRVDYGGEVGSQAMSCEIKAQVPFREGGGWEGEGELRVGCEGATFGGVE